MNKIIDFHTKHPILFRLIFIVLSIVSISSIYRDAYSIPGIKITSHYQGQEVAIGELTVSGISTDNATTPCQVFLDWNDLKPFQSATAMGPGGGNDYSEWSFVYNKNYHIIEEGNNELTAKVSCADSSGSTKYYSINVTGIAEEKEDLLTKMNSNSINFNKAAPAEKNNTLPIETRTPPIAIASENFNSNIDPAISSLEPEADANNTKPYLLPAPSLSENNASDFSNTILLEEGQRKMNLIPPIAHAGNDLMVNEGSSINLNGSGSIDPDGIILSYIWKQNPHPLITLGGAQTKIWTFTAPSVSSDTTFTFELTVSDNNGLTATDSINVLVKDVSMTNTSLSAKNNPPIAEAGSDLEINENTSLTLSGSASSDPDIGDSLNYSWKQTAGVPLFETLSGVDDAAVLTLTSPGVSVDSMFTFELTVSDKQGLIDTDTMNVLVKDVSSSPVFNNNITLSSNSQNQTSQMNIEIEVANDPINLGDEQILTVTVVDVVSGEPIEYADIDGVVTYPSGDTKEFDDDDDGIISYTWEVDSDSKPGFVSVDVHASAAGYEEIFKSITFEALGEEEDKQNNEEEEEE